MAGQFQQRKIMGCSFKVGNEIAEDQTSRVMKHLMEYHLIRVGERSGGWTTLYLDLATGQYWEHDYWDGERKPPSLVARTEAEIRSLYHDLPTKSLDHLIHVGARDDRTYSTHLYLDAVTSQYYEIYYEEDWPGHMVDVPKTEPISNEEVKTRYGRLPTEPISPHGSSEEEK